MAGYLRGFARSVVLGGVAVMAMLGAQSESRADTLRGAMADAYANSPVFEQQLYLLRVEDEGVAQAVAQLRPTLTFVANMDRDLVNDTTTATASLVAEWVLYASGSRRLSLEAAREAVLAARAGLTSVEQQVLLDAVTAYLNVWRDIQVVNVRESNVRVVTQQLRAARDRFEVGEDTRTDVAQAEARLAEARSALAAARGQLEISRELFALAIGRHPGSLSGPGAVPGLPRTEVEASALARQNAPSILQLQHEVTAADLAVQGARAAYGPTITLDGRLQDTFESTNPRVPEEEGASLSLTLRQPIYQGGRLSSLEREALARAAAARANLNQQTRIAVQTVGNAWAQLRIANAQIQAADQRISAAELAFEGVREEAALGARTTLDVLDAEQDVLDARISRIEAQANLYQAAYQLLAGVGLLTVENLDLDVPGYDPSVYHDLVDGAPARVPSVQGQRLDSVMQRLGRD
jgi:outer membrane protein